MLTASQCRAARGLLDWTQQELADAARIGVATIRQFEGGATEPRQATLILLRQALEVCRRRVHRRERRGARRALAKATTEERIGGVRGVIEVAGQPPCEFQDDPILAAAAASRSVSTAFLEPQRAHALTRRKLFRQGQLLTLVLTDNALELVLAPIRPPTPFKRSFR